MRESRGRRIPVPEYVLEKVQRFHESRLGTEFATDYVVYNAEASYGVVLDDTSSCKGWYHLYYSLDIADRPFVYMEWMATLTLDGEFVNEPELSDCAKYPQECEFPIDEAEARQIAADFGLESGLCAWHVSFAWRAGMGFSWRVSNVTALSDEGQFDGDIMYIDANTGTLMSKRHVRDRPYGRCEELPITPN